MTRTLVLLGVLGTLTVGCQSTMSVEEAKRVTASFSGAAFVPPPRTITDITAILDQQKRDTPEQDLAVRARADEAPPVTTDPTVLAGFYLQRGRAARQIGRVRQEIDDLTKAASYATSRPSQRELDILWELAAAEYESGNFSRSIEYTRRAIGRVTPELRGWAIALNSRLAVWLALYGDVKAAEAALRDCLAVYYESARWEGNQPLWIARWDAYAAQARAAGAWMTGRYAEAETFTRRAIAALEGNAILSQQSWLEGQIFTLAQTLIREDRLLEAENEMRRALLGVLRKRGRYSAQTALILGGLANVTFAGGRYAEAETLARAAIDIHEKIGAAPDSVLLARARGELAATLVVQGRWEAAVAEYEAIRVGVASDPGAYERLLAGYGGVNSYVGWTLALLKSGRVDRALEVATVARQRMARLLVGEEHRSTAEIRGLLAMAQAARGDRALALREFAGVTPLLLTRADDVQDEGGTRGARDQRIQLILESYMVLLADVRGMPLEREAGIDAAAQAFRLAEVARGRSVQRALDASAARAAARTPALADLVRREQDAAKQVGALSGALANLLSAPSDQQDRSAVAALRGRIESLARARQALTAQIVRDFPTYHELIDPAPATVERARASLRPGEALIATYVTEERTFVWAIPQDGAVAFAVVPVSAEALQADVARLRQALEPTARTLGDIPPFDVDRAHRLYETLLAPVADGWREARSLLVVPHGPLGQLPFALLPTKAVALGAEEGALFSRYRTVPWLGRTHAVVVLPSVTALATLRAMPLGAAERRPFVGFGDPYFNPEQAHRAAGEAARVEVAALTPRSVPVALRDLRVQSLASARLGILPRLPDTAEEIGAIAAALGADPDRDVFLGERANEQAVKTLDLSRYRVIAFATHGLTPGDLDGLTQPALALTAPEVAKVEGDGLLTMEEILALRLDADWVVLSACNTASGQGAGAEAISGLGRAFFYAGARALLVSNWPVETTSARALTTDLFRRQSADPGLTRAEVLRQTMNGLIDGPGHVDPGTGQMVFSYAHPIFWAPFSLVGDGGAGVGK
jgi:CHAT domain-containing protein